MVVIGDKLGSRYFVTKTVDKPVAGAIVEARDPLGAVFQAQVLLAAAIGTTECNLLAREVASVPRSASLCLPDEITQSASGVPFAIYNKPLPRPLSEELPVFASGNVAEQRLASQRTLFNAFAALAEEYGKAVGARSLHGGITLASIGVLETGESLRLALMGFGIEPAARLQARKERPAPRVDPSALLLTLHDVLTRTQCVPEGSAQARWSIAQSCARAGDHPALQSPAALAKFLRDVASEIELNKRSSPPGPRQSERPGDRAIEAAITPNKPADKPAEKTSDKVTAAAPTRLNWIQGNRRTALVGGVGIVIVAVVAGYSLAGDGGTEISLPGGPTRISLGGSTVPLACGDEPVAAPSTAEVSEAVTELAPVCNGDGTSLFLVAETLPSIVMATRASRRGQPFAGPASAITDRALELGTTLSTAAGSWVAWRPRNGAAFSITSVGATSRDLPLRTAGWEGSSFHGAFLLDVGEAGAWIASTLDSEVGPVAVAVRLTWGASTEAPMTVFRLAEGSVESLLQSSPPQLLVHAARGRQHAFSAITVSIQVLPVIAATAGTPTDEGVADAATSPLALREVPEIALHRTSTYSLEADFATAAPFGVAPPNAPIYFAITSGRGDDAAACATPHCARDGAVSLVAFPAQGDPSAQTLSERGRGLDLGLNGSGHPVALVCEGAACALHTRVGVEGLAKEPLALRGLTAGHLVRCGADAWLAFAQGGTASRVGALPIACLSRRASAH